MVEIGPLVVQIDATQVRQAIRDALPSVDEVARGLHDVVFTFGKPIAPYDELPPETREWFEARARRMLNLLSGDEE